MTAGRSARLAPGSGSGASCVAPPGRI